MSSLPGQLDFPKTEEEICERWKKENTFKIQDKLALERGDEVSRETLVVLSVEGCFVSQYDIDNYLGWSMDNIHPAYKTLSPFTGIVIARTFPFRLLICCSRLRFTMALLSPRVYHITVTCWPVPSRILSLGTPVCRVATYNVVRDGIVTGYP